MCRGRSSPTSATATACRRGRRLQCGASPSAAIAALPASICRSMAASWQPTQLGADQGTYGFRQWQTQFTLAARGAGTLMVRCTNTKNEAQPDFRIWNPAGYLFNTIETTHVVAA